MQKLDVLIVGGGYAGLICALRLSGKSRTLSVGLVNPRAVFVERLRLHEALVNTPRHLIRSFDIPALLEKRGVRFFEATVVASDSASAQVTLRTAGGEVETVGYTRLVVASGSRTCMQVIPGQAEHSFAIDTDGGATSSSIRSKLSALKAPRVTVVGGGATGIEIAAEIAERPDSVVTLLSSGEIGSQLTDPVRKRVRRALEASGVQVIENARVTGIHAERASLADREVPHDLCITATGFEVDPMWAKSGFPVTPDGRIRTDGFLRALGSPAVYAAGDSCFVELEWSAPARMSVMFALASGAYVADMILDDLAGRAPRQFGFWTWGQAIGLGQAAVAYGNMRFDRAYAPYFTGRAGYRLRQFFIWLLFRLLFLEARWPGLPFHLGRPLRRQKADWRNQTEDGNALS